MDLGGGVESKVMKQITKTYAKPLKDQQGNKVADGFRYKTVPKDVFLEKGFSEVESENLEYLLDAQLKTHQCKEMYKRDLDIIADSKKSAEVRSEAAKRTQGIYSYDWSKTPKTKASEFGELQKFVADVRDVLGKEEWEKLTTEEKVSKLETWKKVREENAALLRAPLK